MFKANNYLSLKKVEKSGFKYGVLSFGRRKYIYKPLDGIWVLVIKNKIRILHCEVIYSNEAGIFITKDKDVFTIHKENEFITSGNELWIYEDGSIGIKEPNEKYWKVYSLKGEIVHDLDSEIEDYKEVIKDE